MPKRVSFEVQSDVTGMIINDFFLHF